MKSMIVLATTKFKQLRCQPEKESVVKGNQTYHPYVNNAMLNQLSYEAKLQGMNNSKHYIRKMWHFKTGKPLCVPIDSKHSPTWVCLNK